MDSDFEHITVTDLIHNDRWDTHNLRSLFGKNLKFLSANLGMIDFNANNHRVWYPKSHCIKTSVMVYHQLNQNIAPLDHWDAWKLWKIGVAPYQTCHLACV